MNDGMDLNVSRQVMDVIGIAATISSILQEDSITTLDVAIASLTDPDNKLVDFLDSQGLYVEAEIIVTGIISKDILYEAIVNRSYKEFISLRKASATELDAILKDKDGKEIERLKTFAGNMDVYLDYSENLYCAFDMAEQISEEVGKDYIDLDTLLYCIFKIEESGANRLMNTFFEVRNMYKNFEVDNLIESVQVKTDTKVPKELESFIDVLNDKYDENSTCDILGRDKEIFKVWNIISKKTKRNAVLVGEPGVGKSAIIEAITYSIVKKTCPKQYENYKVYSLNLNGMVAGTKYRGEFEERVEDLIKFLKSSKDIIIFLDEIHHLLGAGSAEKSGPDLSGSLKPLLARDDVVFIGATTQKEYDRIFSTDGALSRRFEVITVKEPRFDEVKPMITARINALSKFHGVRTSDKMIDALMINATSFSSIANPDRTIDLADKAMAVAKIKNAHILKEEHIKMVNAEFFEKYEKMPEENKLSTAYHEAGHLVAWLLSKTKRNDECILVSIVPARDWLGVNMFEKNEIALYPADMTYLEDCVSISLAGRIAQKLVAENIDSGASSDLDHATTIIEEFLLYYGTDKDYMNYSFYPKLRDKTLPISEKVSDEIMAKTKEILDRVYKKTEELINSHKKGVEAVAKALMKKGIITGKEAVKAFNKAEMKVVKEANQ